MKVIELQSARNVRDIGGVSTQDGRVVTPGLFYRGSVLYGLTDSDAKTLFCRLGIRLVVDVRCGWEREAKPDIEFPGVENLHIPFYDKEKVGIEYTERVAGTRVVGRDIACDPDHYYRSLANPLTVAQMSLALTSIFDHAARGDATYQHCSGGKDRAGILSMLILTILGAAPADILDDYLYTNISRDAQYQKNYERFLRLSDGNEELAHELVIAHRARPENLEAFIEAVSERYGSMDAFVAEGLGFDEARREQLRQACTTPQHISMNSSER